MRRSHFFFAAALTTALLGIYGCTSSQPTSTAPTQGSDTRKDDTNHDAHAGHDHDGEVGSSDMDKMKAELAKLPEADRLAAEKQHMCPVSGEMLGTMGSPLKVEVVGQDVWICCEGCKDKLLASPDEYLAKLAK